MSRLRRYLTKETIEAGEPLDPGRSDETAWALRVRDEVVDKAYLWGLGDVHKKTDQGFEVTGSWSCDGQKGEEWTHFVQRSHL